MSTPEDRRAGGLGAEPIPEEVLADEQSVVGEAPDVPEPADPGQVTSAEEAAAQDGAMQDGAPQEAAGQDGAASEAEPDWRDRYVRQVAELDNVRKRLRRDVAAAEAKGMAKLAKELLPALDDFERALQAAEQQEGEGEHELTRGIRLVQQAFVGALDRVGIQADSPKGEPFDPHRHEAIAQMPAPEGTASGVVIEVYQPGYVIGETVLRPARVVVSA